MDEREPADKRTRIGDRYRFLLFILFFLLSLLSHLFRPKSHLSSVKSHLIRPKSHISRFLALPCGTRDSTEKGHLVPPVPPFFFLFPSRMTFRQRKASTPQTARGWFVLGVLSHDFLPGVPLWGVGFIRVSASDEESPPQRGGLSTAFYFRMPTVRSI